MTAIITGIDHPALAVANTDALAEWYCRVLGYQKVHCTPTCCWLLRAPDGTFLEVMPQDATPRPPRTNWTPGWSHLALRVTNLEQAIAALDVHGVQWTGAIGAAVGGGRLRNFADPEGNAWQLVERPAR